MQPQTSMLDKGSTGVVAVVVVVLVVVVGVIALVFSPGKAASLDNGAVSVLVRGSTRWATLALQDSNPVVALMHACYGMAYLRAARRLASDAELERVHMVDPRALEKTLEDLERTMLAKLNAAAPGILPQNETAIQSGWLG